MRNAPESARAEDGGAAYALTASAATAARRAAVRSFIRGGFAPVSFQRISIDIAGPF